MDGTALPISSSELYARLGTASAPVLLDVRRDEAFSQDGGLIIGAFHRSPGDVERWSRDLPRSSGRGLLRARARGQPGRGCELASRRHRSRLSRRRHRRLEGAGLPTRKNLGAIETKWVTREHPKIDRIACPWLISRFINPLAAFLYVPADQVVAVAKEEEATPYDIKGAEFGHVGDHCSFDAIIRIFEIKDPALDHLATIVRGADTSSPDLTPAMRGTAGDLVWAVGQLSRRPRDAQARHGHL